MRLSKDQLDPLKQAARFPPGRAAAMENVIRATEQVAHAADNIIRAAHDTAPPAPASPAEMLEPATPEILSPESTTTQVAPFTPRRRSRISAAVALLMLAFG